MTMYFFRLSYLSANFKLAVRARTNLLIISMDTVKVIPKARKRAKTNNFKSILEQFLEKYDLSIKSSPEQLSEYNKELGASLQDWKARKCVKDFLTRHKYSKKKIEALVLDKRKEKLTIEKGQIIVLKLVISGSFSVIIWNWV